MYLYYYICIMSLLDLEYIYVKIIIVVKEIFIRNCDIYMYCLVYKYVLYIIDIINIY